uniref:Helicase, lymphoid specific n=1 Tax=Eptatretus burgeri TaxID=7764 RepID=A0A8C4R9I4_EPTBU
MISPKIFDEFILSLFGYPVFQAQESMEKVDLESRYEGLQLLLSKSNIYSKFLLTRMEQQQENVWNCVKASFLSLFKRSYFIFSTNGILRSHFLQCLWSLPFIYFCFIQGSVISNKEIQDYNDDDSNDAMKSRLTDSLRKNIQQSDPQRVFNGQQVPLKQPRYFTGGIMRSYQVEGLEWLRMLWENGINAILADEMGLGKTVQCIALIALMVECKVKGPFFVCGPLSTLPNWISEFKRFTPKIPVMLYHGNMEERRVMRMKILRPEGILNICPVIITSYEIAMKDRKHLQYISWRYLILDEGHRIKNKKCRLIRELKQYHTDNKLLLTGTPLQNNLSELWSLLNFLIPEVFDDLKSMLSYVVLNGVRLVILNMLKILRRTCHMTHVPHAMGISCTHDMRLLTHIDTCYLKGTHKSKRVKVMILIFSQMTKMLDVLEDFFHLRRFQYSRLDGSMSYTEREENMAKFNLDPEVFIFMLSTRAGGLGINLTAADTVIIYDSDSNPQVDLQAQDRCHRIGQTRPVMVYRLVTAGTVDQRLVELAITKRRLEKLIIHKSEWGWLEWLSEHNRSFRFLKIYEK